MGFLEALMATAPKQVSGRYLLPVLQHYAELLAPAARARSIAAGSQSQLLQVRWASWEDMPQPARNSLHMLHSLPA